MTEEKKEFKDLVIEEPERKIDGESPDIYSGDSLSEKEDAAGTISDFKALLNALDPPIPNVKLRKLLAPSRVSRIFPDNYLDKFALTVALMVLEQDPSSTFDFAAIINGTQDAYSFGYEGRGIGDLLEAYGAVKEQDLKKVSDGLLS